MVWVQSQTESELHQSWISPGHRSGSHSVHYCQGLPGTARTDSSQEKGQAREGAEVKPNTHSGCVSERAGFVFLLVTDQSR